MKFILSSLLLLILQFGNAQIQYHSDDAKAVKLFEKGLDAYNKREDEEAAKYLNSALSRDPNFYEAWDLLSRLNYENGNKEAALTALYKLVEIDPKRRPSDWFYIGQVEKENESYDKALVAFNTYLDLRDNDFQRIELAVRAKKDCEFAIWAMQHPVPYTPVNLGPNINTDDPEYLPCLTADDQLILFTRRIKDPNAPEGKQDNIYYTVKDEDQQWKVARSLQGINSTFNEGAASISSNGNTLVFTACAFYGDYGLGRKGFGSCDLFISRLEKDGWSAPENMGKDINTANWESQPSLSADGNTVYFIRAPKKRDKDVNQEIFVSHIQDDGNWSVAEKLPDVINTPYKEETVLIHPDGHTLYFSSNGHPGMGGLDIFMSRKDENGNWGEVKNLGYPINTANDENSLMVSTSGELAYFSSNMEGGYGSFDIYSFELYPEARPLPVTYMKGKVYDAKTEEALSAHFQLIELSTGKLIYSAYSEASNGEFLIPITYGENYALNVEKEDYLFFSENFELKDNVEGDPFFMNVPLNKIELGSEFILRNVFFETDEYELKPESKIELNKLLSFLNDHPNVNIEIEGHTDDQGNEAHNRSLSEARAKSVYNYLIENNISKDRLKFKGYAADKPIADNSTEEGRSKNRRTSIQIIAK